MHFAVLVINGHVLLDRIRDRGVVYDYWILAGIGIDNNLQDIEELPGISAAVAHQSLCLFDFDVLLLEEHIFLDSPVKKGLEIFLVKAFENKHLTAGKKGSDHLERGILRCGTY